MEHNIMWHGTGILTGLLQAGICMQQPCHSRQQPFKATECSTMLWQWLCNKLATDFLTMLQQAGSNLVTSGQKSYNNLHRLSRQVVVSMQASTFQKGCYILSYQVVASRQHPCNKPVPRLDIGCCEFVQQVVASWYSNHMWWDWRKPITFWAWWSEFYLYKAQMVDC